MTINRASEKGAQCLGKRVQRDVISSISLTQIRNINVIAAHHLFDNLYNYTYLAFVRTGQEQHMDIPATDG